MWIIGLAKGGFIGPFLSEDEAATYRSLYLPNRVANIHRVASPTYKRSL